MVVRPPPLPALPDRPCPFSTFYSFKGGVGRSMAVINVAGILASRGFRVLVIDMDLEAPGLSYLANRRADSPSVDGEGGEHGEGDSDRNDPRVQLQLGFVDFLLDAAERGEEGDLFALPADEALRRYTVPYELPKEFKRDPAASLHIMPAGRLDGEYPARLDRLDLPGLYREGNGLPLIKAFKQVVQNSGLFDYVFIDSRTGFSDESGICTRDLADFLVIVSGLNKQNVEGTAQFLAALRAAAPERTPIEIVLSPVPNGEDALVDRRERAAQAAFQHAWGAPVATDLHIPYHPQLALTEEPHIFRRRRGYLYEAYHQIEGRVRERLGDTPEALRDAAIAAARERNYRATTLRLRRAALLADSSEWIDSFLVQFASTRPLPAATAEKELYELVLRRASQHTRTAVSEQLAWQARTRPEDDALTLFQIALAIDPTASQTLAAYVNFQQEKRKDPAAAEEVYEHALGLDPTNATNLGNFASFLWIDRRSTERAESLFRQALAADPNHAINLGNFANFLYDERRDLDAAESYYRQAIVADPTNANNLGNFALFLQMERRDLASAEAAFRRAIQVDPNHATNLGNFASFLRLERRDVAHAQEYFRRAIRINPKHATNLSNYANFLRLERRELDEAESFYRRAIQADPKHANSLGSFANFLFEERNDLEAADSFYRSALEADPKRANISGNWARLCLSTGRVAEGLDLIERALALLAPDRPSALEAECWMYIYCCGPAERRGPALARLRSLVVEHRISTGTWNFGGVIAQARQLGHPEAAALEKLAKALAGRIKPATLDKWPPWRAAATDVDGPHRRR